MDNSKPKTSNSTQPYSRLLLDLNPQDVPNLRGYPEYLELRKWLLLGRDSHLREILANPGQEGATLREHAFLAKAFEEILACIDLATEPNE